MTLADEQRHRFVAAARALVGRDFRHRGRFRDGGGGDCVGVVVVAERAIGHEVTDRRRYGRNPANDGLREACESHFGPAVQGAPQAGDVALFAWWSDACHRTPNHVGILFDHPNGGLAVVHALAQHKRVIEHSLDADTRKRIVAVYRPWRAAE